MLRVVVLRVLFFVDMRLAALRISISRWQLDLSALLASLQEEDGAATNKKTLADYARALSGEDE